ncbi:nucleotide sugar dehydrogenase [Gammaproteobacteria bacterium]|jgi:UDP-N-acetyl-D-glucosamine/UDP-N-acetyl-D-galactosamine dehydrogenase|nr:nucleotide sugar dehydrogenase [Gammaproteobacteria bacterium]
MKKLNKEDYKICIVGLGYVGLPLAARFSLKGFDVTGFDIKEERINQLVNKIDINDDISDTNLETLVKNSKLTSNIDELKESNIFIITVPTPINEDKTPDLEPLIASSRLVGSKIKKGSIVIYESTVYPGVTDDICTPILEEKSKLIFNEDFSTGYSPERIVPGDKISTIETITKVVSASNKDALNVISFLYSSIIDAGIHQASSIKVAEAAKVSENIQRDVNIALINEMHQLFTSLGISSLDVIEAASTKWNFMKLTPGLVGGHCISIDPYYLMHKSEMSGYTPNIMMSARKVNDEMGNWVVENFKKFAKENSIDPSSTEITLMGYTFKENCSDTRNTKVHDIAISLRDTGFKIAIWDPYLDDETIMTLKKYNISSSRALSDEVELAFICVYHKEVLKFLELYDGLVYDFRKLNEIS